MRRPPVNREVTDEEDGGDEPEIQHLSIAAWLTDMEYVPLLSHAVRWSGIRLIFRRQSQ